MKKLLLIIIVLSVFKVADSTKRNTDTIYNIKEINVVISKWDLLPYKIMKHETANFTDFEGDSGRAIGYMHMWEVFIDDINRISDSTQYTYEDRMDSLKCIEMFYVYQEHWNPEHDIEIALRIWNSGPKGRFEKYAYLTDSYLNKFEL